MLLINNKWMVRAITVDLDSIMQIHKHFYNYVIFFYILTYSLKFAFIMPLKQSLARVMHLNTALLPPPRR